MRLARALIGPGATDRAIREAEKQALRTLDSIEADGRAGRDVEGPAKWEVLEELAGIARLRGQAQPEMERLVEAVIAAPPDPAARLADQIVQLLESSGDGSLVEGLPNEVASRLWEAAHDDERPDAVVQLAARLALARGHVTAASEVSRQRDSVASAGAELHAVSVVAAVLDLLAEGDTGAAEARLAEVGHLDREPSVVLADALLRYARGDLEGARRLAEDWSGAGDVGTVAVIALLRQAVDEADAAGIFKAARSAATRTVRHDPSSGEPVLLRAQVLLEAGVELELGRELLATAVTRLGSPYALPWWRVQDRARDDHRYTYFRVEVAAALENPGEIPGLAASFEATSLTTYAQDARLRELWGGAADDPDEALSLLRAAASDYRNADDMPAAVRCLRAVRDRDPDARSGLELVDALWAASFATTPEVGDKLVAEGLALMGALEGQHGPDAIGRASLVWGLLLARADAMAAADHPVRTSQRWRPLPHLLLAALLDTEASYTWAHLAWACVDADLQWPAAWSGRRALDLRPGDNWLIETRVVSETNWCGVLDDDLRDWLQQVPSDVAAPGWVATVQAYDLLVRELAPDAADLVPQMDFDAWWAREIRVQSLALGQSLSAAVRDLRDLVQEAERRGQLVDAAWYCLLDDPERGRVLAEEVDAGGERSPSAELRLAAIQIMTSAGTAGADRYAATLRRSRRPSRLVQESTIALPLLTLAQQDDEPLSVLRSLTDLARSLADDVERAPALTVELESQEAWCDDSELAALVRRLLDVADSGSPDDGAPPDLPWLPGAATVAAAWQALKP
ncbi:hypothetical protein GCM10023145_14990 [Angustibacter luteus]